MGALSSVAGLDDGRGRGTFGERDECVCVFQLNMSQYDIRSIYVCSSQDRFIIMV